MNQTEDLQVLRQMQSAGALNSEEFVAGKALLLNYDLSVVEALQRFYKDGREGKLTAREFVTVKRLLLHLPSDDERRSMVRASSIDSRYERRRLQDEAILEQLKRGWRRHAERHYGLLADRGKAESRNTLYGIGCQLFAIGMVIVAILFARALQEISSSLIGWIAVLIVATALFLVICLSNRSYKRDLAFYRRIRAELAASADVPV